MSVARRLVSAGLMATLGLAIGVHPVDTSGTAGQDLAISGRLGVDAVLASHVGPTGVPDWYVTTIGTTLTVPAPGVLLNDFPAHGFEPLDADLQEDAVYGSVVLAGDGSFTYTPPANWAGTDSFMYCAQDEDRCSALTKVTIIVTGVPRPTPSPPLPTPTPPLPTPSPPLPTPTLGPGATATPSRGPSGSTASSRTPAPGVIGPIDPSPGSSSGPFTTRGQPEVDLVASSPGDRPVGRLDAGPGGSIPTLQWAVPAAALAFPGLLLVVAAIAQALGGAAWLPVVRRALRGTGYTPGVRRYRYIVDADR